MTGGRSWDRSAIRSKGENRSRDEGVRRMLKWLVTGREGDVGGLPTITDDPLATLPRNKKDRKNEIYSVNR